MTEAMSEDAVFELLTLECHVDEYGTVRYYNALGKLHREHGPAVIYPDGDREWFQNGRMHRLDGPAVEYSNGRREWYLNGLRHRLGGPAGEYPNIYRAWWQNGQLHRVDGPAIEYANGIRAWHINGKPLTQAEWQQAVASMGPYV